MSQIGQRIKYFRLRASLSQLELENRTNMSYGSLSRIENNEINPTKETLLKIIIELNLTTKESNYINGITSSPATTEEINAVKLSSKEYFNKKGTLAYIVDDRYRLIDVSKTFIKFLGIKEINKEKFLNLPLISVLMNPSLGIIKYLDENEAEDILYNLLTRFKVDVGFMVDDSIYIETVKEISKHELTNNLWNKILNEPINIYSLESKKVVFKINMIKFPLYYSNEIIPNHSRFEIVEYTPTNRISKFISRLFA